MNFIVIAILVLGSIALVAALVLLGYPRNLPSKKTRDLDRWEKSCQVLIVVVVVLPVVLVWLLPLSRVLMPVLSKD